MIIDFKSYFAPEHDMDSNKIGIRKMFTGAFAMFKNAICVLKYECPNCFR